MWREGEFCGTVAAHEGDVREVGVVVIGVGSSPLLIASFERTRDGGSTFESGQSSLGFRRVVDEVTTGPFGTAGETSEETRPGENCKKCEASKNEDNCVEDEAVVVERPALSCSRVSGSVGGGLIGGIGGVACGHRDLAPPALGQ
jgi:hypothetical protein